MEVEWWPRKRVRPNPANPRIIPPEAVAEVAKSIAAFGWQQPLVVRTDGTLLAGHTRLRAARKLGLTEVPVTVADLDDDDARGYLVADNRTGELADWDTAALHALLPQDVDLPPGFWDRDDLLQTVGGLRNASAIKRPELPLPTDGRYRAIVASPPWPVEINMNPRDGRRSLPYAFWPLGEIKALQLPADDHCHLFLWTLQGMLRQSLEVLDEWGFRHRAVLVWCKPWRTIRPPERPVYDLDLCLFAARGKPRLREHTPDFRSINEWPKPAPGNNVKPDEFYALVRRLCDGPRLDVFGSADQREGFDCWRPGRDD